MCFFSKTTSEETVQVQSLIGQAGSARGPNVGVRHSGCLSLVLYLTSSLKVKGETVDGTTLPETNIAPENRPLAKEIPIGNHHF